MARGAQLLSREALPFYLSLTALVGAALLVDALLHLVDAVWIGRWLGIPGLLLILGSFGYSMVKRKLMRGRALPLLRVHERMAWAGSLLVLVHAGVHFNALLPWLAIGAMLINVGSGLTGKYLLARSKQRLKETRLALQQAGVSADEIENRTHWDTMAIGIVQQWRVVHFPITLAFGILALAHILSTLLFWNWR